MIERWRPDEGRINSSYQTYLSSLLSPTLARPNEAKIHHHSDGAHVPAAKEFQRPRVIMRYVGAKNLLISGPLDGGDEMAERAAVVDARYGKGHVLLFASNPIGAVGASAVIRWCSTRLRISIRWIRPAETSDATWR